MRFYKLAVPERGILQRDYYGDFVAAAGTLLMVTHRTRSGRMRAYRVNDAEKRLGTLAEDMVTSVVSSDVPEQDDMVAPPSKVARQS